MNNFQNRKNAKNKQNRIHQNKKFIKLNLEESKIIFLNQIFYYLIFKKPF